MVQAGKSCLEIDRKRLSKLMQAELETFSKRHPQSQKLFAEAGKYLLGGVPMNWMHRWPGGYPVYVERAEGARLFDVDGNEYVDFCLGDTGAMTGHMPEPLKRLLRSYDSGITTMLPNRDGIVVAQELQRRFGLPYWQFALTATDANRFALKIARHVTGRQKVLVFNHCYHGTVEETLVTVYEGKVTMRKGAFGSAIFPSMTTRVVEFNDISDLEQSLRRQEVACVLTEPALTNIGIVHPEPGFHKAMRELTRRYGSLLVLDETHTICMGAGGYTRAHGLQPDMITVGKPLGSGVPSAAYGFSEELAKQCDEILKTDQTDVSGVGGTLAANALSLAAMRVTLTEVLTDAAFEKMISLASQFTKETADVIGEFSLPWTVSQLGCRAEYWFIARLPQNGREAYEHSDAELEKYMHLACLNRGVLMTPFHNMALMSPATTGDDVQKHTAVFKEVVANLVSGY